MHRARNRTPHRIASTPSSNRRSRPFFVLSTTATLRPGTEADNAIRACELCASFSRAGTPRPEPPSRMVAGDLEPIKVLSLNPQAARRPMVIGFFWKSAPELKRTAIGSPREFTLNVMTPFPTPFVPSARESKSWRLALES